MKAKYKNRTLFFRAFMHLTIRPSTAREIEQEFRLTRDRATALLTSLEYMGFIYRKRSAARKNGVTYHANSAEIGGAIHFTGEPGTILPS